MFENLTARLGETLRNLRGRGRLTEDNIKETLREVRRALLEADVALPVVKDFVERVRERAIGQEVMQSLTPGQALIKIVNDELVKTMGEFNDSLTLNVQPPAVVLMAGLQGSGKTTSVAKLARWLKEQHKKSVMVATTDVYRPAAIDQLETLATEVEARFFPSHPQQQPVKIAKEAVTQARKQFVDVLILDTAGRLHIDAEMMEEIKQVHAVVQPIETLFVVDAMTGQDAANTAKVFNAALPLTGVVLTKADGDARGGAALSIRAVTGKPIKFLGMGEKIQALEPFHPERIASRILGMGDVLTLIEQAEQKVDRQKAEQLAKKITQGEKFSLEDFRDQLQQMRTMVSHMGGMDKLVDMLPGEMLGGANPTQLQVLKDQDADREIRRMEAIINSMTPQERKFPDLIKGSRKRRIAAGSGTQIQDVNKMLKQFNLLRKTMKKMSGKKGGMQKLMRGMKGRRMPRGMPF